MRDDQLEGDGLAASGFPADEHVPLCEVDVDAAAGFVGAEVDRVPDRQGSDRESACMVMARPPAAGRVLLARGCPGIGMQVRSGAGGAPAAVAAASGMVHSAA